MKKFRNGDRIVIVENADDVSAPCIQRGMIGVIVDDKMMYDRIDDWYDVEIDGLKYIWGLKEHHMDFLDAEPLISESDLMEVLL